MIKLCIIDESQRAFERLKSFFQGKYDVQFAQLSKLDKATHDMGCPEILLYLSKGDIRYTKEKVERIRQAWPKSYIVLVFPTLESEAQLGDEAVPAHRLLFKPCSKKRVLEAVENYASIVSEEDEGIIGGTLLSSIVEYLGGQNPDLYVFYNRLVPLIATLCARLGYDWAGPQAAFNVFVVVLSNVDKSIVKEFLDGDGKNNDVQAQVNEHIQKMSELLKLSPSTNSLSEDIKYILKRYDGKGLPKDEVKELELPVASRMIRLLMDYHRLLQGGQTKGRALFILHQRKRWYDEQLVAMLVDIMSDEVKQSTRDVYPLGLVAGMEIAEDLYGMIDGKRRKILSAQEILTEKSVDYIQRHCDDVLDITEPVKIVEELFIKQGDNNA